MKCHGHLFALLVFILMSCSEGSRDEIKIKPTQDFEIKADTSIFNWKEAAWISLPHRNGPNQYLTKLKILYSKTGIYCLYFCEDKIITATLKEDFSNLYNEDVVEVFFWPDESEPLYFEYELSPLNYELPILVPNFNGKFLGWLPWHYEGARKTRHEVIVGKDSSWTASFFIPYSLLMPLNHMPPGKATAWRCNFYRIDYDEGNSEWSWQLTQTNFHDIKRFGKMIFD